MSWDKPNGPFYRIGYVLTQASGAPSASGQVSLWNQSGTLQVQTPLSGALNLGDPLKRLGFSFTDTVTAPVASGTAAVWANSGFVQVRTPQAQDIVIGTQLHTLPMTLSALSSGNSFRTQPGFACSVAAVDFVPGQTMGTSGSAIIQVGIQGNSCSGGVVTLLTGLMSAGARIAGTAITGANTIGTSGEITATVTSALSGAFGPGIGSLVFRLGPPA